MKGWLYLWPRWGNCDKLPPYVSGIPTSLNTKAYVKHLVYASVVSFLYMIVM